MTDTAPTAPRQLTPYEAIKGNLVAMREQFQGALPPQISVDKFLGVVTTGIRLNPALQDADRTTLFGACLKAAADGLLPDGREAALVLYGKNVQYMPMLQGLLKKARNSGAISRLSVQVVYSADEFVYELGDDDRLIHKPALGDRGEPVAAYAIAWLSDGSVMREVMSREQIEKVRSVSRAKGNGPWVQWWDEMARKTVFRRLAKWLPSSTDLANSLAAEDEHYDLSEPKPEARSPMQALKAKIGVAVATPAPQSPPLPDAEAEFRGDAESAGGDA